MNSFLSLHQAASLMGLGRHQARRRLLALHRERPDLALLRRANAGQQSGWWQVDPSVLRLLLLPTSDIDAKDMYDRVGFLESDVRSLQARIGRVEKRQIEQDLCSRMRSMRKKNGANGA